jgi:hypothetical protein|nr:MAG TPA: hypothetical protein [Caudoviricetes sp.]
MTAKKIQAIEAMIAELTEIKEVSKTEEEIVETQTELENLEKVSIGDIPDEEFEEFVKTHKAAVSAAKQKILTLRIALFEKGIPPFLINSNVWTMEAIVKKCNCHYL